MSAYAGALDVPGPVDGYYAPILADAAAPEPATWVMMLLGFAGLGFAGYRKAKRNGLLAA
jgi:PEP-CTERM motif